MLLQPDTKGKSEPHTIDLASDCIFSFIVSYPDTMHLEESLIQPDRSEFMKAAKKGIERSHQPRKLEINTNQACARL